MTTLIDSDGFRPNVGIILVNSCGQVLWARRVGQDAWQFPQGGIDDGESPEQALYRELYEEVGLRKSDVKLLRKTQGWLRYRLPKRWQRHSQSPLCVGQKQKWYMLKMLCQEVEVKLDISSKPEFDQWRWVSYWHPVGQVIQFKRDVYRRALKELAPSLPVMG